MDVLLNPLQPLPTNSEKIHQKAAFRLHYGKYSEYVRAKANFYLSLPNGSYKCESVSKYREKIITFVETQSANQTISIK